MQFQWIYCLLTSINKKSPKPRQKQTRCMPSKIHSSRVHLTASVLSFGCLEDVPRKMPPVLRTFRNNCINSKISHRKNGDIYSRTIQMHPDLLLEDPDISRDKSGRVHGSGISASEYSCVQNSGLCNHPRCPRSTPIIWYDQDSFFVPPQTHPETSRIHGPILVQLTEPSRLDSMFHSHLPGEGL